MNKIIHGNAVEILLTFESEIIDLTITSPPYDSIREYQNKIKNSEKYDGFSFPFYEIADQIYRVTKGGGVLVWIVGDAVVEGGETGNSFRQALYFQQLGFKIHDTMIYMKNGPTFPARSDSNRYSQIFEYMFVFSKDTKPKTANLLCDKPNRWVGQTSFGDSSYRGKDGKLKQREFKRPIPEFSPRYNIWKYNTGKNYSTKDEEVFKHPAIFPEKLVEDHIRTWSKEGDIVLDPMCGSGTTCKMAVINGRQYIGIDISEEYVKLARKRIKKYQKLNKFFK